MVQCPYNVLGLSGTEVGRLLADYLCCPSLSVGLMQGRVDCRKIWAISCADTAIPTQMTLSSMGLTTKAWLISPALDNSFQNKSRSF